MPLFGSLEISKPQPLASASAFASGRPSPVPLAFLLVRAFNLAERFERLRDFGRRHADAGVGHGDHDAAFGLGRRHHPHRPPAAVNFSALEMRLISTCLSERASATHGRQRARSRLTSDTLYPAAAGPQQTHAFLDQAAPARRW